MYKRQVVYKTNNKAQNSDAMRISLEAIDVLPEVASETQFDSDVVIHQHMIPVIFLIGGSLKEEIAYTETRNESKISA